MISKTIKGFLAKLSLCLMIAMLVSSCSSTSDNYRKVSGEESTQRIQDTEFYKHKVDRTLYY